MTSVVAQLALEESGVMEQDIGDPASPKLEIMLAIPIGSLRGNPVAPRMKEHFQVLIPLGDSFESFVGPIVEVYPRG